MRIAIIDLGTNTFNLLIAEVNQNGTFKKICTDRIPVKLGEGSINQGYISEIPFKRGIDAINKYHQKIIDLKVNHVKAFATSAIRSASNGILFVNQIKNLTGIEVEIIDGNREADLIFKGANYADAERTKNSLIMDIGGGSTEFIIVKENNLVWKKSYPLGAARLLQHFQPEDPMTKNTFRKINSFLSESFIDLIEQLKLHQPKKMIGTSGAFDSFVDMLAAINNKNGVNEHSVSYEINLEQFNFLYDKVISSTHAERKEMKGLISMRVDMIVISFILAKYILTIAQINQFFCCTYSLKEGALIESIKKYNLN
jgi:exopolyphosphatase/guanosine-5'-triphosphate,3'-diphosphate pyrophosphatase